MKRRFDAALNDERIVVAALQELSANPNAGMDQLAAAAGVGRATLYRRFPSRDDLLERLRAEAKTDALEALTSVRTKEGTAAEALERLIAALLPVADRYGYLGQPSKPGWVPDPVLAKPWLDVIKRGQRSGELSATVSPEWWLAVVRVHFKQAADAVSDGMPVLEAARLATRALLEGLRG